ncbi:pyrokinin-1 receptor [Parasteatoda tepidariorum]|uniref:pyrokinin-1 receptor n=1 Tax=Parasteatoda tepidariorum TaxID=114398 RepID=UPI00077F9EF1|nr:pyrokinin-1 receptor-like [Parasteatoda tepidariorum]
MEQDYYYINPNSTYDSNFSNCDNTTIEECLLGPQRDPLTTVIPMTLVYGVILTTGVIGNLCTCTVIAKNRYMHTATNYYLFSLAVSDLLLLVLGLPQEIYQLWYKYPYIFGQLFCFIRGWTSEMCTNASILTITAFTVERYVAICHPFRAQTMSHLPRAVKTIILIWIAAAVLALPTALQFGIKYEIVGEQILWGTALCSVISPFPHIFEVSTFVFFVLPMALISVLYIFIGIRLRQVSIGNHSDSINDCNMLSKQKINSRKSVVKMLGAVVTSFFICWSPFHAQRLLAIYSSTEPTPTLELTYTILTYISGVTYYLSATVNPILYQLMSGKFRQALKDTFYAYCKCCGPKNNSGRGAEMSFHCDNSRYRISYQQQNKETVSNSVNWMNDSMNNHKIPT